jgi:hypothetical protein
MNHGDGEKRIEACGETFPADDQAAVLPLEPRNCAPGLEARGILFNWAPTRPSGSPHPFGELGPDPASAESMTEVFGLIPLIRRQDLEPFARSAPFAGADVEGIQQWEDLGPLVTIRRRRARGQRHASAVREAVDENAFAFPAIHRRRIATESSRVPRPARTGGLASQPESHHLANAVTKDTRHSLKPIGVRGEDHTSGSR